MIMKNTRTIIAAGIALAFLQQVAIAGERPANLFPGHEEGGVKRQAKVASTKPAPRNHVGVQSNGQPVFSAPINGIHGKPSAQQSPQTSEFGAAATACTPTDFAALSGSNLLAAIKSADKRTCIYGLYSVAGGSLAGQLFSESKMLTVANAITAISYDGTDSSGILNLINYLRAGYYVQYGYPADVPAYSATMVSAARTMLDNFFNNPASLTETATNGEILNEFLIAVDSTGNNARYLGKARNVIKASKKSWLDIYELASAGLSAQNVYFNSTWDAGANAALQADPTIASDLYAYYNANKASMLGGVASNGYSTDWYIVNVIGEYTRLLQFSSVHAAIKPNVIATVNGLNKNNLDQLQVYARLGDLTNDPYVISASETCATYNTCGYATFVKDKILSINYSCPGATWITFRAQEMTASNLTEACNTVANEVALFHAKTGTTDNNPVPGDLNNHIEMDIFNNSTEYGQWAGTIFGISTNNGGMYLEGEPTDPANQPRFVAYEKTWSEPGIPDGQFYIWNLTHEFTHYLDGRFIKQGNYEDGVNYQMVYWAEGLAEFNAYTYEGRPNYKAITTMQAHPEYKLSYLFKTPTSPWDVDRVYRGGWAGQSFLFNKHPEITQALITKLRAKDYAGYVSYVNGLGTSLDAEFAAYWPTLAVNQLVRNVALTGLSAAAGKETIYAVNVPVGATNLKIVTSLGTGNVNLSIKSKATPTDAVNDCLSAGAANAESCTIAAPVPGTYWVRLKAQTAYSGVKLLASYTTPILKCTDTTTDHMGQNCYRVISANSGMTYLALSLPAGAKNFKVRLSGGTGDADLYVSAGSWPSTTTYDVKSANVGNAELVSIPAPTAGWNYIAVDAKQAFSKVKITTLYDF